MIIYFVVVPVACILAAWFIYPVLFPQQEADRIHKAQQEALKRHKASRDADTRRVQAYWAERGKTLKPMDRTRYCDQISEHDPIT